MLVFCMENTTSDEVKGGKKTDYELVLQIAFIAVLAMLLFYNAGKVYGAPQGTGVTGAALSQAATGGVATGLSLVSASEIVPKGVPEVYGTELKVKYDDVSASNQNLADATMQKLAKYEAMQLNDEQMKRYVLIGSSIACEYCCGAQTLVFENGERACGCAHSYAMRGLAKYLLTKHPEMTDEQILTELAKWKVLFFPSVHAQKASVLKAKGIDEKDYINLASNKYRGVEQGQAAGGSMVGGC